MSEAVTSNTEAPEVTETAESTAKEQTAERADPEADSKPTKAKAPETSKTEDGQKAAPKTEPEKPAASQAPPEDIETIKGENYALKAGIKPEYAADAVTLAKSRVKEGMTLEQAVASVAAEYPMFRGNVPKISPSVPAKNDAASADEDERIDRIMGIKK